MNPTIEDLVMAHRYRYYVLNDPVMTDFKYDVLEHAAKRVLPETSPVHKPGSDLESSYTATQKEIAAKMI